MAVFCGCINVIVPVAVLEEKFPGGLSGYQAAVPNRSFCCDGTLTRVGFMSSWDTEHWCDQVEANGLLFLDAEGNCADMAVVDMLAGPTAPCDWLDTGLLDGQPASWAAGSPPGPLVDPQAMPAADSSD